MGRISDERKRLLTKISTMYYIDGLNQQEITETLAISRPQISRMLAEAKDVGIVKITINDPFANESEYEKLLIESFGLTNAVVIDTSQAESAGNELGIAAANLLELLLTDNDIIGINAGNSLSYVGNTIRRTSKKNIGVVPLVGGWGPSGAKWQANLNVRNLAERLGCDYWQLNAPAFVSTRETHDALIKEEGISYVLSMAKKISIALVGIGQVANDATIMKTGFLDAENLKELKEKDAVASICNSFINREGKSIRFSAFDRMIGLSVEDIREVPNIIAVAEGKNKVDAILAALKGRWINHLITTAETAEELLS